MSSITQQLLAPLRLPGSHEVEQVTPELTDRFRHPLHERRGGDDNVLGAGDVYCLGAFVFPRKTEKG